MKGLLLATVAAVAVASSALAGDVRKPMKMSDEQLDNVVAGQIQIGTGLVTVQVGDVTVDVPVRILNNSVNNNTVQIPVAANVGAAVAVLGNAAAVAQQFGRQN
jgi:translation elongation factor EF-G